MEKLAKSYIEKRIQQARNTWSDEYAVYSSEDSGLSQAEHALEEARIGSFDITASHLHLDKKSSVRQK